MNTTTPAEKVRAALRTLARNVRFTKPFTQVELIHVGLTALGLDAQGRFHAFAALRHAALGAREAGNLSGALSYMSRVRLADTLRRAADLVIDF